MEKTKKKSNKIICWLGYHIVDNQVRFENVKFYMINASQ